MSNREQRNSPPGAQQNADPSPPGAARLADELTAVLKLLATQKTEARAAETQPEQFYTNSRPSGSDSGPLSDLDQSAAIDRIQDEISALEERFAASPAAAPDAPYRSGAGEGGPWDAESAEALTRTYEAAFASANAPSPAASDRDWLESRFSDIAAKIESSLVEARDSSARQLEGKLGNLETRICDALDSLATRSDVAGIDAMASQFDRAAGHLSRLDTIESNLEAVLDRLSDERFYSDAPPGESRHFDVRALAEAAANNVVSRLSEMGMGRVDAAELTEIRQAIDLIVEERRRHDEQSTAILDTLQQAMISVLDRVDALTESIEGKYGLGSNQSPPPSVSKQDAERSGEAGLSAAPGLSHHFEAAPPADGAPRAATSRQPLESAPATDNTPQYDRPASAPAGGDTFDRPPDDRFSRDQEDRSDLSAIDRIRQDLIAEAKRAKQQATEQASQTLATPGLSADLPRPKSHAARGDGGRKKRSKGKSVPAIGPLFGMQRRKLLVGAVIVLFATAGALMMMRATSSQGPSEVPATIEQPSSVDRGASTNGSTIESPAPAGQSSGGEIEGESGTSGNGEESRSGTSPEGKDASADAGRAMASNLRGITLQSSRSLTPQQYAMLSEKQAMAHFSEQLGEAAAHATPAAFPQSPADSAGNLANPGAGSVTASRAPLNLPPATVGPMSLRIAAAKGDPSAEFEVGVRLAEGTGTNQDFKEAARWYQRSASQGFAQAQYRLGTLYERGLGMPKDLSRAAVWYQRAADNGNVKAMHNLAVLSAGNDAGEADYATAVRWFTAAAERGLADSQYNLAILHENGLGTAKDSKQAYKYFALAARSGDRQAKRRQEKLAGLLSSEDLITAKEMVETWRRKPVDRLANDAHVAGEDWKSRADNRYGG